MTLSRRHLLRGAGGVALALPWLEAMGAPPSQRFIMVYTPGGTLLPDWLPRRGPGGETDFTLHSILAPLEPWKRHLLGIEGLGLQITREGFGHTHTRGMAGLFTGQPTRHGEFETDGGRTGFADGPSVDQVIARRIGRQTALPSLELALRWPSPYLSRGRMTPGNCLVYEQANLPLPYEVDPRRVWARLWGGQPEAERARSRSVLDAVADDYAALAGRLGADDRRKLEAHATRVREVEQSLATVRPAANACAARPLAEPVPDYTRDADLPATGKLFMDLLVLGLRCDLFRVATLQWVDSTATNTFPGWGCPTDITTTSTIAASSPRPSARSAIFTPSSSPTCCRPCRPPTRAAPRCSTAPRSSGDRSCSTRPPTARRTCPFCSRAAPVAACARAAG